MADSLTAWLKDKLLGQSADPVPADDSFRFQPGESTGHAMLRYGGNELLGAARSPIDALKNLVHLPGAMVKGWTEDIPALMRDPSLLTEAPRAAMNAGSYLAMHPTELGSQLGQAVIGKAAPTLVENLRTRAVPTHAEGLLAGAERHAASRAAAAEATAAERAARAEAGPRSPHAVDPNTPVREFNLADDASIPAGIGGELGPYIGAEEAGARVAARRAAKGR